MPLSGTATLSPPGLQHCSGVAYGQTHRILRLCLERTALSLRHLTVDSFVFDHIDLDHLLSQCISTLEHIPARVKFRVAGLNLLTGC